MVCARCLIGWVRTDWQIFRYGFCDFWRWCFTPYCWHRGLTNRKCLTVFSNIPKCINTYFALCVPNMAPGDMDAFSWYCDNLEQNTIAHYVLQLDHPDIPINRNARIYQFHVYWNYASDTFYLQIIIITKEVCFVNIHRTIVCKLSHYNQFRMCTLYYRSCFNIVKTKK